MIMLWISACHQSEQILGQAGAAYRCCEVDRVSTFVEECLETAWPDPIMEGWRWP